LCCRTVTESGTHGFVWSARLIDGDSDLDGMTHSLLTRKPAQSLTIPKHTTRKAEIDRERQTHTHTERERERERGREREQSGAGCCAHLSTCCAAVLVRLCSRLCSTTLHRVIDIACKTNPFGVMVCLSSQGVNHGLCFVRLGVVWILPKHHLFATGLVFEQR
jgi:hypothetical protein